MSDSNNNVQVFNFAVQNLPVPYESKNTSDNTWVHHGLNNLYPIFLLDLYTNSSVHSSVINVKSVYIQGDGLKLNGKDLSVLVNAEENVKQLSDKIIKDYLLFNSYAVEVCFHPVTFEPVEYHHVPVHKLRMNKSKTKFWYYNDWFYKHNGIVYDRYSVASNNDAISKIFYFDGYFPSVNNVYSTPEYNGALKSIATNIAIQSFNLNNIKNQFSASSVITFFQGSNVNETAKQSISDNLQSKFSGENGQKIVVDFQPKDGQGATVQNLSVGDWADAYNATNEVVTNDIIIGHGCQNGSLFGIQTAGKLGGSQELEIAFSIFKTTYIEVKRDEIETALNQMFTKFALIPGKVKFKDKPLFNSQLSDDLKKLCLTIDELRSEANYPPMADGSGAVLIATLPHVTVKETSATVPVAVEATAEEVKKKSGDESKTLTENDYNSIEHLGEDFEAFDVVEENFEHERFDLESDVAEYIISHDVSGLTMQEIVELLQKDSIITDVSELKKVLDKLKKSGVVSIDEGGKGRIAIKPLPKPKTPATDAVTVMYRYAKRDGVDGDVILPTSRGFCKKLIGNNRLYTRAEIQSMGAIFGYDIYTYCGGFYFNPVSQTTTSYCRHQWNALRVKRKIQ